MSSGPPPPPFPYDSGTPANQYPQEKGPGGPGGYDPSTYGQPQIPQGYGKGEGGYLALVDENTGEEVGIVDQVHISGIQAGSHDPVQVELPPVGSDGIVTVRPAPPDYLQDAHHPAYANSTLVSTAAAASRFIVTASTYVAKALESGADSFTKKTKPLAQPMTFTPATHNRVAKVHNFTIGAAKVSSATLGKVQHHAQNIGAKLAGKNQEKDKSANPGILSKGMIAFSTVADGIDHASKVLLTSSSSAATAVVQHRYGPEAGDVARGITGSAKNVGLVYVDAAGVSRRAIVKSVAKGMVVGKVRGGGEVIVQGENGSQVDFIGPGGLGVAHVTSPPPYSQPGQIHHASTFPATSPMAPPPGYSTPTGEVGGYNPQSGQNMHGASLNTPQQNYGGYQSGRSSPVPGSQGYSTPQPQQTSMYPPPPRSPAPDHQQQQVHYRY